MNDKSPEPLTALGSYLDDMLRATDQAADRTAQLNPTPVLLPQWFLVPAPIETEPGRDTPAEGENDAEVRPGEGAAPGEDAAPGASADSYQFPLQCLMFQLGRHSLAIPLFQLGSVQKIEQAPTRLPGSPCWLLGMVDSRGARLRVVDGLQLISNGKETDAEAGMLLVLADSRWAISCTGIDQVVDLDAADISWRRRGLYLGTIRQSLSGLLNPAAILKKLDDAGPD